MPKSETFNMDCLAYMKGCKDKQFSLLATDPPYGDCGTGEYSSKENGRFGPLFKKHQTDIKTTTVNHATGGNAFGKYDDVKCAHWDVAPTDEWWREAWRIADNLLIWGANYFAGVLDGRPRLPASRNFIIWLKPVAEDFSLAQMEYCYISIPGNSRIIRDRSQDKFRFHATQKPLSTFLKPFEWNIRHIDKDKGVLDPFMGSGTSRIAAWDMGINYVGIEINETYFQKEEARFAEHIAKGSLYEDTANTKITECAEGLF